jgi:hypothetical protein
MLIEIIIITTTTTTTTTMHDIFEAAFLDWVL